MKLLTKLFDVKSFIKKEQIVQDIPSSREIYRRSFDITWPAAIEMVLLSLMVLVDMIMVSGIGVNAVSAVGITNQPRHIILAPIFAINIAITVLISRKKGENDRVGANLYLRNAMVTSVLISFVLSILFIIFARDIVTFIGATPDYVDYATIYLQIIMIGNMFGSLTLTITAAQRGAGFTKISMKTNMAGHSTKLLFNFLLIYGILFFPALGIRGAALATLLGSVVSFTMAIYSICHKDQFLFVTLKQKWLPHKETIKQMFLLGRAVFIEQIFVRSGMLFYDMQIASLGTLEFATHQIIMKILAVTFSLGEGFSVAASSLVGQNIGKKRPDLAIIYSVAIQRIGIIVSIILALFIVIFRVPILGVLSMWNLDVIATGYNIMIILAVCVLIQLVQVITIGSLRGAGDLKYIAILMFVSVAIIRPVFAFILIYFLGLGLTGAWIAVLMDQAIRTTFSLTRFSSYKWLHIKV